MECAYILEYRVQNNRLLKEESKCLTVHNKEVLGETVQEMRPSPKPLTRPLPHRCLMPARIPPSRRQQQTDLQKEVLRSPLLDFQQDYEVTLITREAL